MKIKFNHLTQNGVQHSIGELLKLGEFQYALHYFQGYWDIIELSTGLAVASISGNIENVNGMSVRDYLLDQLLKSNRTLKVIEEGKAILQACDISYPINSPFND